MDEIKPAKLKNNTNFRSSSILGRIFLIIPIIVIIFAIFFIWSLIHGSSSIIDLVTGQTKSLQSEEGKVNILLLGISGGSHDGANLTDTIMVASSDLKSRKVDLISLPRDFWVEKYKSKVNTLYQLGLSKDKDLDFTGNEIGEILGMQIPYAIRVDFNGFKQAVDIVGGMEVDVEKSFDDYFYPLEGHQTDLCGYQEKEMDLDEDQSKKLAISPGNYKVLIAEDGQIATASAEKNSTYTQEQVLTFFKCRFEHIHFDQGINNMDGETALKFVRSRNGTGGEGSDFARSKRQQRVLVAFKNKVLSLKTLTDPQKVINLLKNFGGSIDTNIPQSQFLRFIQLVRDVKSVESHVIDARGSNPLLISPPSNQYGAWVLIPAEGDYNRIHKFVDDILTGKQAASESAQTP